MQGKCSKAKARVKGDNWMKAYSFWFLSSEMLCDKCALAYNEQTKEAISEETLLQSSERLGSQHHATPSELCETLAEQV